MTYSISYKSPFDKIIVEPPKGNTPEYAFWNWRTSLESTLAAEDKMDRQAANVSSSFALAGTALAVTFGIAHTVLANVAPDSKTSSTIIGAVETGLGAILAGVSLYLRNLYNPNNPNDNSFKMRQQALHDMLQAGVNNNYLSFETAQGIAGIYLPGKTIEPSPAVTLTAANSSMFASTRHPVLETTPLLASSRSLTATSSTMFTAPTMTTEAATATAQPPSLTN